MIDCIVNILHDKMISFAAKVTSIKAIVSSIVIAVLKLIFRKLLPAMVFHRIVSSCYKTCEIYYPNMTYIQLKNQLLKKSVNIFHNNNIDIIWPYWIKMIIMCMLKSPKDLHKHDHNLGFRFSKTKKQKLLNEVIRLLNIKLDRRIDNNELHI